MAIACRVMLVLCAICILCNPILKHHAVNCISVYFVNLHLSFSFACVEKLAGQKPVFCDKGELVVGKATQSIRSEISCGRDQRNKTAYQK